MREGAGFVERATPCRTISFKLPSAPAQPSSIWVRVLNLEVRTFSVGLLQWLGAPCPNPTGALHTYFATLEILQLRLYCLDSRPVLILAFLFHGLVHKSTSVFRICETTDSVPRLETL